MMTLQELLSWLKDSKGTGRWQEVADLSGVEYNTISRVARGYMKTPSIVLVERLVSAIRTIDPPKTSRKSPKVPA